MAATKSSTRAKKETSKKAEPKQEAISPWRQHLLRQEGALIGWFAVSAYLLICLSTYSRDDPSFSYAGAGGPVHNAAGVAGAWSADILYSVAGWLAYLFPVLLIMRAWNIFQQRKVADTGFDWVTFCLRAVGLLLVMTTATALAELHHGGGVSDLPNGVGGILGSAVGGSVASAFSYVGSTLILLAVFLFGVTVFTDLSWLGLMDKTGRLSLLVFNFCRSQVIELLARRKEQGLSDTATEVRKQSVEKKARKLIDRKEPVTNSPAPG